MNSRRTPFDVFDEMERMMDGMRRSVGGAAFDSNVSVETGDDEYVVVVDMPGFERSEIDLRFEDGVLLLDALHEVASESAAGSLSRSRSVNERVRIPAEIDEDGITASYRNGVLEVRLPTIEAPEDDDSHRIDVE